MSGYEIETLALLAGLVPVALLGCFGGVEERLVAMQLVAAVSALLLMLVAVATGQSSILVVPLTLPVLGSAGTLVYTRMLAPHGDSQAARDDRSGQGEHGASGDRSAPA